ncbi:FAD-dependent oxidoreductase [Litoribacterium kuwaitense]|uniref:FAD-dependent oxidoreductase n=1 Tax=Litoribacterium kuwaitense TaxID=1398745 RepID=UPI0028AD3EB0|nr:FAD-dependent oxidoreductase [Litoribacterium kuwaitense]
MEWQSSFGVEAEWWDHHLVQKKAPGLSNRITGAIYRPEEAHVYAPHYVQSLKIACERIGVQCFDHTFVQPVQDLEAGHVKAGDHVYEADQLIICSGAWAKEWEEALAIDIPIMPIRGQICAYQEPPYSLPYIVFSSQGYLVQKETGVVVAGATEDIAGFQTSVTEQGIQRLQRWAPKLKPSLQDVKPFHQWAGLRPATRDGYPLIGRVTKNPAVLLACGHYRNGILLSPVTAKLVADLLEEKSGVKERLQSFDPTRFQLNAV